MTEEEKMVVAAMDCPVCGESLTVDDGTMEEHCLVCGYELN